MKNPTLATVLNILPGLGYIYIGGPKRLFGITLLAGVIASFVSAFNPALYSQQYLSAGLSIWDLLALMSLLLFVSAFMYDGYLSANAHNASLAKTKKSK